jgi:integrase
MRRGEMLALRWADVADDYSVAQVRRTVLATHEGLVYEPPKTRRSARSVMLPAFLRPYLEGARAKQAKAQKRGGFEDHGLVVCRPGGVSYNPDTVSSGWAPFLKRRGLPHCRFHDLRHAHATLMLQQGVHPKIVSERLGHASIGITLDTYSHVLPSMQQEAAAAVDAIFMTPEVADVSPGSASV